MHDPKSTTLTPAERLMFTELPTGTHAHRLITFPVPEYWDYERVQRNLVHLISPEDLGRADIVIAVKPGGECIMVKDTKLPGNVGPISAAVAQEVIRAAIAPAEMTGRRSPLLELELDHQTVLKDAAQAGEAGAELRDWLLMHEMLVAHAYALQTSPDLKIARDRAAEGVVKALSRRLRPVTGK